MSRIMLSYPKFVMYYHAGNVFLLTFKLPLTQCVIVPCQLTPSSVLWDMSSHGNLILSRLYLLTSLELMIATSAPLSNKPLASTDSPQTLMWPGIRSGVVMTSVMTSHNYLDLVITVWSKSCASCYHQVWCAWTCSLPSMVLHLYMGYHRYVHRTQHN